MQGNAMLNKEKGKGMTKQCTKLGERVRDGWLT